MSIATTPAWTPETNRLSCGHNDKANINEGITTNSPLLFEMLKKLSATEQRAILDMGQASQSSVDFFGDYKCKLFIADAISDLYKLNKKTSDTPQAWLKTLGRIIQLNQQNQTALDMILLWSLPNYLSPLHLKALIDYLLPHTSGGMKLHAYIYNTQMMPAAPAHYQIRRNNKVAISPATSDQINCPLYHLADLHNFFKPFRAEHSVMLSSGIQEYVFSS